jgi:hypothetical protein
VCFCLGNQGHGPRETAAENSVGIAGEEVRQKEVVSQLTLANFHFLLKRGASEKERPQ